MKKEKGKKRGRVLESENILKEKVMAGWSSCGSVG
jgi:hypothetical protein